MQRRRQDRARRLLELAIALPAALATAPLVLVGWFAASLSTRTKGIFRQLRVGRDGREFDVYKLRTMVPTPSISSNFTAANDPRITRVGRVLRRSKVDELPQLWQVVVGQMALVGPRPDVHQVIDQIPDQDRGWILAMAPGVTGPATIYFRDEEELLQLVDDPEAFSIGTLLQCKTAINIAYMAHSTMSDDLRIVWSTVRGGGIHRTVQMVNSWDPTVFENDAFRAVDELREALDE